MWVRGLKRLIKNRKKKLNCRNTIFKSIGHEGSHNGLLKMMFKHTLWLLWSPNVNPTKYFWTAHVRQLSLLSSKCHMRENHLEKQCSVPPLDTGRNYPCQGTLRLSRLEMVAQHNTRLYVLVLGFLFSLSLVFCLVCHPFVV